MEYLYGFLGFVFVFLIYISVCVILRMTKDTSVNFAFYKVSCNICETPIEIYVSCSFKLKKPLPLLYYPFYFLNQRTIRENVEERIKVAVIWESVKNSLEHIFNDQKGFADDIRYSLETDEILWDKYTLDSFCLNEIWMAKQGV